MQLSKTLKLLDKCDKEKKEKEASKHVCDCVSLWGKNALVNNFLYMLKFMFFTSSLHFPYFSIPTL